MAALCRAGVPTSVTMAATARRDESSPHDPARRPPKPQGEPEGVMDDSGGREGGRGGATSSLWGPFMS